LPRPKLLRQSLYLPIDSLFYASIKAAKAGIKLLGFSALMLVSAMQDERLMLTRKYLVEENSRVEVFLDPKNTKRISMGSRKTRAWNRGIPK